MPRRDTLHRERLPLLVLGGGIAGLGAADEALRAGVPTIVVERAPMVGGMLRTDRREGFSFDRGGHRFITSLPWVQERIIDLLGDRLRVRERRSLVLLDGTTVVYPLQLDDLVRQLGLRSNVRALASYCAARGRARRNPEVERTLEEWLERRFGTYLYRRVFEGYSQKLWGMHPSAISAEWAPERISVPDLGAFFKQLLWPRKSTPRTWAKRYLYPRTGIGEIVEALERKIVAAGGDVRTQAMVRSLTPLDGGRWRATIEGKEGTWVSDVRGIVSTIPLETFARLVPNAPPAPRLGQRGLRFTNIAFDRPIPLDATWIYQPDPDSRYSRLQIPAARSPEMVPPGCGSVQLEEPWDAGDADSGDRVTDTATDTGDRVTDTATADTECDTTVTDTAVTDTECSHLVGEKHTCSATADLELRVEEGRAMLATLGAEMGEPRFAFTTTEASAYPIYTQDARAMAERTIAALEARDGVAIAGRQGRFRYCFLDRAYAEGVNGARRLLGLPLLENEKARTPGDPLPLEATSIV